MADSSGDGRRTRGTAFGKTRLGPRFFLEAPGLTVDRAIPGRMTLYGHAKQSGKLLWSWDAVWIRQDLEDLTEDDGAPLDDIKATFELLRRSPELHLRQHDAERARLLQVLVSNCRLDGENVISVYKNPST